MIKNGHKLFAHVAAINDDSFEGDELFKVSIKNWSDETNIDSSKIIVDNEFELGNIVDTSIPRALQAKEENMHDLQDYVNLQEDTRILENIFQSNGASDNIITSPDTTQSMHNLDASYYFENNFLIYDNSYDAIIESYANLL